MAGMLPNGPLQVVFSFDTTGSMSGALKEVRGRLSDMLQRLQTDIPGVTTAVVAHGDYCDKGKPYLTKHIDFSDNLPKLVNFVNNVKSTYGGDEPEAYEVMLRLVRKNLKWTAGSQRILVVIGDAFPHPPNDRQNKDKIDWREESRLLQKMGVRIYGVQVDDSDQSAKFFKTMTDMTDGQHLKLSEFGTLCDVIMAICYREKGAEFLHNYEAEVRAREGRLDLHKDLEKVFGVLRRAESSASSAAAPLARTGKAVKSAAAVSKKTKTGKKTATKKSAIRAAKTTDTKPKDKRRYKSTKATPTRTKATPTSTKATPTSTKATPIRRLNREKVPDTNFRFNQLQWSPWKLAVVPAETRTVGGPWRRFLKGVARARGGAVLRSEATRRVRGSVMCEAAVQRCSGARRHIVWCRVLPASSANQLSLSRLLTSPSVRAQLGHVIRNGCRLWVRWARVSRRQNGSEFSQEVKDVYDYAWCSKNGSQRDVWVTSHLSSDSVQIAGPMA